MTSKRMKAKIAPMAIAATAAFDMCVFDPA
jgi:hypothetical protein